MSLQEEARKWYAGQMTDWNFFDKYDNYTVIQCSEFAEHILKDYIKRSDLVNIIQGMIVELQFSSSIDDLIKTKVLTELLNKINQQ